MGMQGVETARFLLIECRQSHQLEKSRTRLVPKCIILNALVRLLGQILKTTWSTFREQFWKAREGWRLSRIHQLLIISDIQYDTMHHSFTMFTRHLINGG